MIRIGICDDQITERERLRLALEKTDLVDGGDAQVVYEFNSGAGLVRWMKKHKGELDLLFLDVEMGEMNGIEAARRIREFDGNLLLVFLTGYDDFVFQGYEVDAMEYLIKPFKEEELSHILQRAWKKMDGNRKNYLLLKNGEGIFRLYKDDILYCYSQGRQTMVVMKEKELAFYKKLDQLEEALGSSFVRIHQRYLVNSRFVNFIGRDSVTMEGDYQLPISRSMKEKATTALAKNMLGGF